MQYVFDTNILIDLHENYYPEIFQTLWDKFEELIREDIVISLNEVKCELKSKKIRDHWMKIDNNTGNKLFIELTNDDMKNLSKIEKLDIYREKFNKNSKRISIEEEWGYGECVADPLLIIYGLSYNACVVTNENIRKKHNIPHVCDELNVKHIDLKQFFIENKITF